MNEVILWKKSTYEMVCDPLYIGQGDGLTCAALSSNGKMIATGSEDSTVQR